MVGQTRVERRRGAAASSHVEGDFVSPAAPSAGGGSLLADDDAQGNLLGLAGRADASEPGVPLALDSARAPTDAPHAGVPSISGDDAHAYDDVWAVVQGANRPPSATGGCRRNQ